MARPLSLIVTSIFVLSGLTSHSTTRGDVAEAVRHFFGATAQAPHPSVVQVLAPDRHAIARGSGTLIHVDDQLGYVITNWHVVRDAAQDVLVVFPSGHQSLARVLKMNTDWDLALLLVWAGDQQPMPLSLMGPGPGDSLTIAGYGSGNYRAQRGVFSTYAAPRPDMPFEMFEVTVAARQGDSGGPVINQRGELVGVLFGSGDGKTTGTQIGRVRMFVNEAFADLRARAEFAARDDSSRDVVTQMAIATSDASQGFAVSDSQGHIPPAFAATPRGETVPKPPWVALDRALIPLPDVEKDTAARESTEPTWETRELAWKEDDTPPTVLGSSSNIEAHQPQLPEFTRVARPAEVSRRDLIAARTLDLPSQLPAASLLAEQSAAAKDGSGSLPLAFDIPHPQRVSGRVTWSQLRSFFAAVGIFAILHCLSRVFFLPKKKPGKKK